MHMLKKGKGPFDPAKIFQVGIVVKNVDETVSITQGPLFSKLVPRLSKESREFECILSFFPDLSGINENYRNNYAPSFRDSTLGIPHRITALTPR